jgi:hypothetical protein
VLLILVMAAMPTGVAGAARAAANAVLRASSPPRGAEVDKDSGANVAANYGGKEESP